MPPLRPRPSPLPILPLAAACLMLLAAGQLGTWVWQAMNKPKEAPDAVADAMVNPFSGMAHSHPKAVEARMQNIKPQRVVMPLQVGNLQFGDATSDVVVTLLSDPACGACRQKVRSWLQLLPRDVRIVSKFWPQDPTRLTPGILLELARREGVAEAFLQQLERANGDLDDAQLLSLLEKAGVSLEKQRAALSDGENKVGQALQPDLQRAKELQLPPPPVMIVNGYVMDGAALLPEKVASYVERLKAHQPLTRDSDYWLMEK